MSSTGLTVTRTEVGALGEHATVVSRVKPSEDARYLARQIEMAVERFGEVVVETDFEGKTWLIVPSGKVERSSWALV